MVGLSTGNVSERTVNEQVRDPTGSHFFVTDPNLPSDITEKRPLLRETIWDSDGDKKYNFISETYELKDALQGKETIKERVELPLEWFGRERKAREKETVKLPQMRTFTTR